MDRSEANKVLDSIGKVPKPIPEGWLEEAYSKGMLRKSQLVDGVYYYGRCRNAKVAKWSTMDDTFTYMRTKFDDFFPEEIRHPVDDNGYDLFVPVMAVEPFNREKIK